MDSQKGKASVWISAMRLRTLPLAASCVLTGSAINWQHNSQSAVVLVLTLTTTLLLQILSNLANDYGDHIKGTDNADRIGPTRAMQTGVLSASSMKNALILFAMLSLVSGLSLLYFVFYNSGQFLYALLFLLLGLSAIGAAIKYTVGKNPYGYRGFGDLFVFLFFGLIGVCGTSYLHDLNFDLLWILPGTTIGLLSAAVLNLNNLRDHINDAASNKMTLVVKLGFGKGKIYLYLLIAGAFIAHLVYLVLSQSVAIQFLSLLPYSLLFGVVLRVAKTAEPAQLDPYLKKVAISTFLISLILFVTN